MHFAIALQTPQLQLQLHNNIHQPSYTSNNNPLPVFIHMPRRIRRGEMGGGSGGGGVVEGREGTVIERKALSHQCGTLLLQSSCARYSHMAWWHGGMGGMGGMDDGHGVHEAQDAAASPYLVHNTIYTMQY